MYVLQCSVFFCCVLIAGTNPPFITIKVATDTEIANAMIIIIVSEDIIVNNDPPCNL